jgi:capsular exopolysaccharide synthesis family protein
MRSRRAAGKPLDETLVALLGPQSIEAEPYRSLAVALERPRAGAASWVVAITSAQPSEGKTTTAVNLAAALSHAAGPRVLLVDADLRRPAVAERLGPRIWSGPSLTDRIRSLPASRVPLEPGNCPPFPFSVLPAGPASNDPQGLLRSPRFGELMREVRENFDLVVVDAPPVLPVSDCTLLSPWIDGYLLVVAADATPRGSVREAIERLERDRIVGLVLNRDHSALARYYRYYSSYAQPAGEAEASAE